MVQTIDPVVCVYNTVVATLSNDLAYENTSILVFSGQVTKPFSSRKLMKRTMQIKKILPVAISNLKKPS